MNNFKSEGCKLDYIERETRGEKGSRWNKGVGPVMKTLEEIRAMHVLSYLDTLYVSKVGRNGEVESIDVKKEKKHDSEAIRTLYSNYLYHEVHQTDKYANRPYLKHHYMPRSCMLTSIIETYHEAFQKKGSNGKKKFKENTTY